MTLRQLRYFLMCEVSGVALMAYYGNSDREHAARKKTLAITAG